MHTCTYICSHYLWVAPYPFISPIPSLSVGFSWCLGIECRLNENVISFGRHLECRKLKFISVFLARMRRTTRLRRRSGREVAHWGANSFDCGLLPRLLSCYQTQTAPMYAPLWLCKFTIVATPPFLDSRTPRILRVMLCDIFRRYINNEFIPQLCFNLWHFWLSSQMWLVTEGFLLAEYNILIYVIEKVKVQASWNIS